MNIQKIVHFTYNKVSWLNKIEPLQYASAENL